MSINPYLKSIFIYPVKSLDGMAVNEASILASGALQYDRQYAIFDRQGKFVNGKRNPKIYQLRSIFNSELTKITLQIQGQETKNTFSLREDNIDLQEWLRDYFGFSVQLQANLLTGFPDDLNANGPTLISTATLEKITSWFAGLTITEIRRRFRANLEIDGVPPFWEDQLFAEKIEEKSKFQIGDVRLEGINPCQRCLVPTKDSFTGKPTANFQKIFSQKRRESLPDWTHLSRFNHFYKVSINTNIPVSQAGKILRLGDKLTPI